MMRAWKNKQCGIGFAGLIFVVAAFLFVAILGMKLVPAYMHDRELVQIFKAIAADPEMQNAAAKDVRISFSKRAMMNNLSEVAADDIQVDKEGGRLVLSASYQVKIPVAGNISLVLEFNPSSAK